jgi:hypothetical protein
MRFPGGNVEALRAFFNCSLGFDNFSSPHLGDVLLAPPQATREALAILTGGYPRGHLSDSRDGAAGIDLMSFEGLRLLSAAQSRAIVFQSLFWLQQGIEN